MSRVGSLGNALAVHTVLYNQAVALSEEFKNKHRLTWWIRPGFWKLDNYRINQHRKVLTARIKLATAEKEKENSNGR